MIKENQEMLRQKRARPPHSGSLALNKQPPNVLFEMQVKDENGNLRPLQKLEKSASGGTILPNQIIAQSNPFGKGKKSIVTLQQDPQPLENLSIQKISTTQKWLK